MSKQYATEQIQRRVVSHTTCDGCGKSAKDEPNGWTSVTSGHYDWGNDSVDSQDDYDACSQRCLQSLLAKIHKDYGSRPYPTLYVAVRINHDYESLTRLLGEGEQDA